MSQAHPFLALSPEAKRQLARVLVSGLASQAASDRAIARRHGALSASACAVVGAGLGLAWQQLAAGDLAAFGLGYSGWLAAQAAIGSRLAHQLPSETPSALRWAALAPYEAFSGLAAWLRPPRTSADRLILAGGILTAVRRPVSYHLLRRLYGRAYPQVEVEQAVSLLLRLGVIARGAGAAEGVLHLTQRGAALLKELGVPAPAPRPQQDPQIALHMRPLFTRLEQAGHTPRTRVPDIPEKPPAAVGPELPRWAPEPVAVAVEAPAKGAITTDLEPDEAPVARPRRRVSPWVAGAAAAVAAVGVVAYIVLGHGPSAPRQVVRMSAAAMPNSQGTAIQLNGRGLMLSSFAGSLFLSIPDRLDYKRPLSFKDYDMASACGLDHRPLSGVSMAPHGRFLIAEMGAPSGPAERCLIDTETKTVTHDLAALDAVYGLPTVLGWAGDQTLVLSDAAPGARAEHWWAIDVTSRAKTQLNLPSHGRVLPVPIAMGGLQAVGLDLRQRGVWDITSYFFDDRRTAQKIATVRVTLPEALKEDEPVHAALSPDKRYLLMTMRPVAPGASHGGLVAIELASGQATVPDTAVSPAADQPIFWGPEVRGGRYRFFFNGCENAGPYTGELLVKAP